MTTRSKPRIIALEEHYWDEEVAATFVSAESRQRASGTMDRLYDYGELRIKEMDEAGIDLQVISHGPPGTQRVASWPGSSRATSFGAWVTRRSERKSR